ncbi:MAG: M48 family metallopeptidase, partial [candidate division WOR-3 bacterium]
RVGTYLDACEDRLRQEESGLRQRLTRDGIRLTERLSPRIHEVFRQVCLSLDVAGAAEIYCIPGMQINAFAKLDIQKSGTYYLVVVTTAALEVLEDSELKSILGHELGHILFEHNRLQALFVEDKDNPAVTVLPPLGESLLLRWQKKSEISADRVGLLACGDFKASATALMKGTFGLSEKNLNLDIDSLIEQFDEIKGRSEMVEATFASHPLLPIRLKALQLFARSRKAARNGFAGRGTLLADDELESSVDALVAMTRRYPAKPLHESVMKAIALGGVLMLGVDGDIGDEETKILIQILHHWFTDEPEKEIVTDRELIIRNLPQVINVINEQGDDSDKQFILSRLADVALADGALLDTEGTIILKIAEMLKIPPSHAYGIIVGAAQTVGFRTDAKLNRVADELRKSLETGLGAFYGRS